MHLSRLPALTFATALAACGGEAGPASPDFGPDRPAPGGKADDTSEGFVPLENGLNQNGLNQNGLNQNGVFVQVIGADLWTTRMLTQPPRFAWRHPDMSQPTNPVRNVRLTRSKMTNFNRFAVRSPFGGGTATPARVGIGYKNALITATMTHGHDATLWIKNVEQTEDPDIFHYWIKVYQKDPAQLADPRHPCTEFGEPYCRMKWSWACTDAAGQPLPAIAMAGQFNYDSGYPGAGGKVIRNSDPLSKKLITFACVNGSYGKCIDWGYRPWEHEQHHESCARLVRADYCGINVPLTFNGNKINIYDDLGIQSDEAGSPFRWEADWSPNGATCGSGTRMIWYGDDVGVGDQNTVAEFIRNNCPGKWGDSIGDENCEGPRCFRRYACADRLFDPSLGGGAPDRALITSEYCDESPCPY